MKKIASVIFFVLMILFIIFLYNFFPTEEKEPVAKQPQKEVVVPKKVEETKPIEEEKPVEQPKKITKADKIIALAKTKLNLPYKQAGTTDNGYDCSGLVMISFKKEGVQLPRASYEMVKKGKEVPLKEAKKGDLIFFTTNATTPNKINHVGLITFVENGVAHFIHSTLKRGVVINNTNENYYKKTFAKVKRVLKDD